MLCIDFEGTNLTLRPPADMTDEECETIKAYQGVDSTNTPFILTAWQPSFEDIKAINEGRPIMLKTLGVGFAPVCLYTFDENFNANE